MRIISQDGTVDVQYEHVSIEVNDYDETTIMAICLNDYSETPVLGKYKTKERALEVMEEIRKRYADFNFSNCCHFNMDKAISVKAIQVIGGMFINNCIYEMPKE